MIANDRERFFRAVRELVFGGTLAQGQVDGINGILDAWEAKDEASDPRFVAYSLATAFWETAQTMQPIAEYGHGAGKVYGTPDPATGLMYYGRGLVQLTWKANYAKMSEVCGIDLVGQPERAMEWPIAGKIMVEGMTRGMFTGRKLGDYFVGTRSDWVDARAIINGHDRAAQIAGYGMHFYSGILGE